MNKVRATKGPMNPCQKYMINTALSMNHWSRFIHLLACSFLLLSLFASCKSSKNAAGEKVLRKKSSRFLLKRLDQQKVDMEWLSAKTRISFEDESQSLRASATIRLRKDSLIWMNVKKLSIELARVKITPDSVYIINRLTKEYIIESLDFVARQFQLPASFEALQNTLLGNPPLVASDQYEVVTTKDQYQLKGDYGNLQQQLYLGPDPYTLEAIGFEEPQREQSLKMILSDYRPVEGKQNFSYLRNFEVNSPETGGMAAEIKFIKTEINKPKSLRFEIPSHYTRMQ